jgi:tetratricopeptide (TPR) repeat protein
LPRQKSTHVDDPRAVGERLRAARERAGLSQRQLSFPGCSPAYISRIESGDRIPSLQLLRELGRRLGVTEDYLATGLEHGTHESSALLIEAEVALRLGDLDHAERLYNELADHSPSGRIQAHVHAGLGQLHYRRGDPHAAIEQFERALAIYGDSDFAHFDLADSLGRAYAMVGDLKAAVAVFDRSLAAADSREDALERIRFQLLLGEALIDSGDFRRAEEILAAARSTGSGSNDPSVRASLYWTQSRLHSERNDPETAARYARRALEVLRLTEDAYRTARAYQLLAYIENNRGEPDSALRLLEEGWPLLETSGNPLERAQYRLEEARALAKLGRDEEAGALAMQISGIIAGAHPEDAGRSYTVLAGIYEDLGDRAHAVEVYELAAELLERNPNHHLVEVHTKLAELCEADGRTQEAYEHMKKAVGAQRALSAKTER